LLCNLNAFQRKSKEQPMPKMMLFTVAGSSALAGAALVYLTAGRRVTANSVRSFAPYMDRARAFGAAARDAIRSASWKKCQTPRSANSAFEQYRTDALRSLEDEQREFNAYLGQLRRARDQAEFHAFIADRKLEQSSAQGADEASTTFPE
jgi:hypothetical protein